MRRTPFLRLVPRHAYMNLRSNSRFRYAYNIVPHPMEQKREGKFTLRIFSRKDVCVEPVTETFTTVSNQPYGQLIAKLKRIA